MKIFKYQFWNLLYLIILLILVNFVINDHHSILSGNFWGCNTFFWFIIALLSPILHQFYVLIFWRLELHYKTLTKKFGVNGFKLFKKGFAVLILSRIVTITLLAFSNMNTLNLPSSTSYLLAGILFLPAAYLGFSVVNYFGINRAFGDDHFELEKAKDRPFVKKGIFKYTSNGMYIYGFLILYIPGLLLQSEAALILAIFNHLYIWGHHFFTEKPDINIIYNS